jgi:hypothetical protein
MYLNRYYFSFSRLFTKKEILGIYTVLIEKRLFTIITKFQIFAVENEFRRKEESSHTTS